MLTSRKEISAWAERRTTVSLTWVTPGWVLVVWVCTKTQRGTYQCQNRRKHIPIPTDIAFPSNNLWLLSEFFSRFLEPWWYLVNHFHQFWVEPLWCRILYNTQQPLWLHYFVLHLRSRKTCHWLFSLSINLSVFFCCCLGCKMSETID